MCDLSWDHLKAAAFSKEHFRFVLETDTDQQLYYRQITLLHYGTPAQRKPQRGKFWVL